METPEHAVARLVDALEDLVAQESVAVHTDDYALIEFIQLRAGAIGEKLASLAADAAVPAVRRRVEALQVQRWQNGEALRQRLADVSAELGRLQGVRQRLTRVAPAYGRGTVPAPRFTAAA